MTPPLAPSAAATEAPAAPSSQQDLAAAGIQRSWARFIFEDGVPAVELVIETTVETRPDAPGFDRAAIDRVVQTALRLDTQGNYDRIIVEPVRP